MKRNELLHFAEDRVLAKQLHQLLGNVKDSVLVVTGFIIFIYWLYSSESNSVLILGWAIIAVLFRLYIVFDFRKLIATGIEVTQVRPMARRVMTLLGVDGIIIGVLVFLVPIDNEHMLESMMLVVTLTAIIVISMSQYSSVFLIFLVRATPICIPLIGKLLLADSAIFQAIGVAGIVCATIIVIYAKRSYRFSRASIDLGFENIDLVEKLRLETEHTQALLLRTEQAKLEAEHANASKSKFLAAASHDLRQPLHALSLFTSVLDELIQSPKVRTVVDQINSSVDALQNLFNALLDISQLDAGVMKVDKRDFNLQPLFHKIANDYDAQATHKGLKIIWPTESYAVHSDPILFEQILRNFVSNALRYTDKGEISIHCEDNDGLIRIRVTDTGVGIPESEQEIIFEEFHQLTNVERDRSKGLGLGLSIVKRTAKLLQHPIFVESQSGKGSSFSIELKKVLMTEKPVKAVVEDIVSSPGSILIVVIDDEKEIRKGTQILFEQWGCDVIAAAGIDDAVTQLTQANRLPDGIISDYRLSEKETGIDAIDKIFTVLDITIPALIVTGDIAIESLRKVDNTKFQMLHKPVAALKMRTFLRNVQLNKLKNSD